MAVDLKANFVTGSRPRASIGAELGSGTKLPIQPVDRSVVSGPNDTFVRKPIDRQQAPAGTNQAPVARPRNTVRDTFRNALIGILRNVENRAPGAIGEWASRMAKAMCSAGGGDDDFGTTKLPIQPT